MELDYCTDCKQSTVVTVDHRSGDTICVDCGLVLESRYIDTTAEWRKFTESDDCGDPSRVGVASNPLFDSVADPAATVISPSKNKNWNSSDFLPRRFLATASAAGKSLRGALQLLDQMSDGLSLMRATADHAKVLFKWAHDHKKPKGKNLDAVVAACLYLACKGMGVPRELKEFEKVANGSSQKAINRAKNQLLKIENVAAELGGDNRVIKPTDIARRCCSRLQMDSDVMKSVSETLRNVEEQQIDIRRKPNSVVAAVMYLVVQLYSVKANLSVLSQAACCDAMTTKRAYKDLYPYASRIVPNKFKFGGLLNNLCAP